MMHGHPQYFAVLTGCQVSKTAQKMGGIKFFQKQGGKDEDLHFI
jgi:hypothetical protein